MRLHISSLILRERLKELTIEDVVPLYEILTRLSNISQDFKQAVVFDPETKIIKNKNINIYVNGVDIRSLNNLDTKVKEEDELLIIPPVMGG